MDEFHKLEQRLIERGLHAAWNLFNTGENDIEDYSMRQVCVRDALQLMGDAN